MKDGKNILEIAHISKSFLGVKALDDVSLSLSQGEVLALVGENGARKSTLIKIHYPPISLAPRLQPPMNRAYRLVFPVALTFAHLARAAAASLALTVGLLRRSFFLATLSVAVVPFTLAHLAFAAALMAALPAVLIRRLPFLALAGTMQLDKSHR